MSISSSQCHALLLDFESSLDCQHPLEATLRQTLTAEAYRRDDLLVSICRESEQGGTWGCQKERRRRGVGHGQGGRTQGKSNSQESESLICVLVWSTFLGKNLVRKIRHGTESAGKGLGRDRKNTNVTELSGVRWFREGYGSELSILTESPGRLK